MENQTTVILMAIDEEFRRTHGKPFNWLKITLHIQIREMVKRHNLNMNPPFFQSLFRPLQIALQSHPLYDLKQAYNATKNRGYLITRKRKYPQIDGPIALLAYLAKHPEGIPTDSQLLDYTYPKIASDVELAISKRILLNIYHTNYPREDILFILPNICFQFQSQYSSPSLGMKFYLDICRQIVIKQVNTVEKSVLKDQTEKKKKSQREEESDPNYKISAFRAQKEAWLQKKNREIKKNTQSSLNEDNQTRNFVSWEGINLLESWFNWSRGVMKTAVQQREKMQSEESGKPQSQTKTFELTSKQNRAPRK